MIAPMTFDAPASHAPGEGSESLREQLAACRAELDIYKAGIRRAVEVCREAARGNLESRVIPADDGGELGELLRSINHLLDLTDAFVREASASLRCAGEEKFYRRILPHGLLGCFRSNARLINGASERLEAQADSLRAAEGERLALADDFEAAVDQVVQMVAAASTELHATSETMVAAAHHTTERARSAAQSSGQVAGNMASIASASEVIAATLQDVEPRPTRRPSSPSRRRARRAGRTRPSRRSPRPRIRSARSSS